ncbi:LysR substrate-binding domain-containing protein [Marinomonas sp. C2222]|uniref:LysR substrate-binding domain-containing protein n=1 Tax=Marinomonas sargassi TaxID=2984494 RepID=A0ABT2YTA6_9GAMM|nr:LysR substrate-binding domain-containing protein [Marinomonas sargassi]MCV2403134.1 LysR substrate-binding domain-containing protein [Marinomonas sargassi]
MAIGRSFPPLKSLQAFRYAAQFLSFKEAAETLFVTQAAVSQQIKLLESTLGVTLFDRQTRQVILTPEGQYLFEYIEKAFHLLEEGVKGITEDPNPNTLVISSLPSFASRWLVPRLAAFQNQAESINLHLSPSLNIDNFTNNDLDICIRLGQGNYEGLKSSLLFEENLVTVCHPDLVRKDESIYQRLTNIPFIADSGPDAQHIRPTIKRFLNDFDLPITSHLRIGDSTALIEALLSKQGFAMTRFGLVYELLEKGQLVCPVPIYMKSRYDFYLVAPSPHFRYQKVIQFKQWIEKEVRVINAAWKKHCLDNPDFKEMKV